MSQPTTLCPGNAHSFRFLLTQLVLATGAQGPLAGRTDGRGWISATDGGPPLPGHTEVVLTERAAGTADYVGSLAGDVVTTITAGLTSPSTLYEVVQFGSSLKVSNPIAFLRVRRS